MTAPFEGEQTSGAYFESLIGRRLGDRYELQRLIGEGGFGGVFVGRDSVVDRQVAIKVRRPQVSLQEGGVRRFFREAKVLGKLRHPNAVQVLDFCRDDSLAFIVMELCDGRPLGQVLAASFPLAPERIVDICVQILHVLDEAHALGIVHRDLKPANVIIESRRARPDFVKVVDFGLAALKEPDANSMTTEGFVAGTPEYMSPEQSRGQPVDGRSDIYAMGCMIYEMLCGAPPFHGATPIDTVMAHMFHEPMPPSMRVSAGAVPPALEMAAMWCLAKLPDERPSSADELRVELVRAARQGFAVDESRRGSASDGSGKHLGRRSIGSGPASRASFTPDQGVTSVAVLTRHPDELQALVESLRGIGNRVVVVDRVELAAAEGIDVVVMSIAELEADASLRAVLAGGPPLLLCGADDDIAALARAIEIGAQDFVPLPINPVALKRSLTRALKARKRGGKVG
jgi:serine/threonine-protein kinase